MLLNCQYRCQSFLFIAQILLARRNVFIVPSRNPHYKTTLKVMGSPNSCEIIQRFILSSSVSPEELLPWPCRKCKSCLCCALALGCNVLVHFVSTGRQSLVLVKIKTSNSSIPKCKIKASIRHLPFGPTTQKVVIFLICSQKSEPRQFMSKQIFHVCFGCVKACVLRPYLDSKLSLVRVHLDIYSISYYLQLFQNYKPH